MSNTKYSTNPGGLHAPKPGTKGYVGTWTPPPPYDVTTSPAAPDHRTSPESGAKIADDGLLRVNPMTGLRRKLRVLRTRDRGTSEPVKAMTSEQLTAFLETARTRLPVFYPLALLLARSGLRLGEALGLRWTDVDLVSRTIRVERTLGRRVKAFPTAGPPIGTPKSGRARTVDMSQALSRVLGSLLRERREEALRRGQGQAAPAWVFLTPSGQPLAQQDVREDFARVLRWAGLPGHFTPHCLRPHLRGAADSSGTRAPALRAGAARARLDLHDGGRLRPLAPDR
jgi:integrase